MKRINASGRLLHDESVGFIEIQSLQQRQAVSLSREIEREFPGFGTFAPDETLRQNPFFETAQYNVIRRKMSISSLHDRIYRQRIFPKCIKTCPFIHGRNNQGVFESNHFSGLTIIEVLVSILQSVDAVFARSNTPNCETSTTVGTPYTFKGYRSKGRIS